MQTSRRARRTAALVLVTDSGIGYAGGGNDVFWLGAGPGPAVPDGDRAVIDGGPRLDNVIHLREWDRDGRLTRSEG